LGYFGKAVGGTEHRSAPHALSDKQILERLLALNLQRAAV
jgi:hypothetical protein